LACHLEGDRLARQVEDFKHPTLIYRKPMLNFVL
jgi:hypothetical protein